MENQQSSVSFRSVYSKALLALAVCLAGCDLELKFQEIHFHNPIRTAPVLSLNQLSNAECDFVVRREIKVVKV